MRSPKLIIVIALAVLLFTPGCALINVLVDFPTPTPVPQRALRATFTPTATRVPPTPAEVPAEPQPEATSVPELAAENSDVVTPLEPLPGEQPPEQPPEPMPEPPTATPTPFVVVAGDLIRARSGPGTTYDQVGELGQGTQLAILSKNEAGDWWQVCCLNDQPVWVFGDLVTIQGSPDAVAVAADIPPSPTPTFTPEPKPLVVINNPTVNVRTAPSTGADVLGQVGQGTQLEIVGRNQDSDWWQVCCVAGQPGWISAEVVNTEGPVEQVALAPDLPTPAPQPTNTPTQATAAAAAEPTSTPDASLYPFELTEVATFPFDGNDYLRVAARVGDGAGNPLGGYHLRVRNDTSGQLWLSGQTTDRSWQYTAPSADFADFREANLEFDTSGKSPLAGQRFVVWLEDAGGQQVAPAIPYAPDDGEFQWLYVVLTRK